MIYALRDPYVGPSFSSFSYVYVFCHHNLILEYLLKRESLHYQLLALVLMEPLEYKKYQQNNCIILEKIVVTAKDVN